MSLVTLLVILWKLVNDNSTYDYEDSIFTHNFCDSNNSTCVSDDYTSDYVDSISYKDLMTIMALVVNIMVTILTCYDCDN